jgi:hypothetical protein
MVIPLVPKNIYNDSEVTKELDEVLHKHKYYVERIYKIINGYDIRIRPLNYKGDKE